MFHERLWYLGGKEEAARFANSHGPYRLQITYLGPRLLSLPVDKDFYEAL